MPQNDQGKGLPRGSGAPQQAPATSNTPPLPSALALGRCATVEPFPEDHPGRPDSGRFKEMFVYAGDEPDDQGCRKRTSESSSGGSLTAPPEDTGDCSGGSSGGWPVMVLKPKASGEPPTVVVKRKWYATPYEAYKAAQRALEKLHDRGETAWEVILG